MSGRTRFGGAAAAPGAYHLAVQLPPTTITASVDFDADGLHHGHLQLPYSRDDAAYGSVMIPIAVAKHGDGPTVLLAGGNHGDEYMGPLAMLKLANTLAIEQVTGRIIVLPCMNQPAFAAGTRTSPIDAGNLNRSFPGRPDGTHTERIADYVTRHLLPLADVVADVHDGGRTLEFVPMASSTLLPDDPETERASAAAAEAFGAPYVTKLVELDMLGMFECEVVNAGKPFITTELGGAGTTRPELTAIADRGIHNLLVHWSALAADPIPGPEPVRITVPEADAYIVSEVDGVIEWLVALGEPIAPGQVIARVHEHRTLGVEPVEYRATVDGILAMRHVPGLVKMGDAIAMQARIGE